MRWSRFNLDFNSKVEDGKDICLFPLDFAVINYAIVKSGCHNCVWLYLDFSFRWFWTLLCYYVANDENKGKWYNVSMKSIFNVLLYPLPPEKLMQRDRNINKGKPFRVHCNQISLFPNCTCWSYRSDEVGYRTWCKVSRSRGCKQTVVGMETDYLTPTSCNILRGNICRFFFTKSKYCSGRFCVVFQLVND